MAPKPHHRLGCDAPASSGTPHVWVYEKKGSEVLNPELRDLIWNHKYK